MSSRRKPLGAYAPGSSAGRSYGALWKEIGEHGEAPPITRGLAKGLAAFRPNGSS